MAKFLTMDWKEDFEKVDEALNIATVFVLWLCFFAFVAYILYRAF